MFNRGSMKLSLNTVIACLISLAFGVGAGIGLSEWGKSQSYAHAIARAKELGDQASNLAEEKKVLKDEIRGLNSKIEVYKSAIANRDELISDTTAEATALRTAADDERMRALRSEFDNVADSNTSKPDTPADIVDSEKPLKLTNKQFRGEHPVAGGPFTVTQVRMITSGFKDNAELVFEFRNDSELPQDSAYFSIDIFDIDGNLLESRSASIHNWPSGASRTATSFTENFSKLHVMRITH